MWQRFQYINFLHDDLHQKVIFPGEYDYSTLCRIDHLAIHRDIARKTSILLNIIFCVWKNMRLIWLRRTVKIKRWWVTKKQKNRIFKKNVKKIFFKKYFVYFLFFHFFQNIYFIFFAFKILKIVQNGPAVAKLIAYFSTKIQIILFKILEIVAASPKIENTYIVLYIHIHKK